jgi:hypothetical protein
MAIGRDMASIRNTFYAWRGSTVGGWGGSSPNDVNTYRGKSYTVNYVSYTIPSSGSMDLGTLAGHADAIATNCNCDCNCNCTSNSCGATCFVAGSRVLMADLTWRRIETLRPGDMVMSSHGPARVAKLDTPVLGDRKLYRMQDGSITWSAEHSFWVNRDGRQWLWTLDLAHLKWEASIGDIGGVKDFDSYFIGEDRQPELFAHIGAAPWKKGRPVHVEEADHTPELPLYLPITENGELIIVNGYLVGAGVNEHKCDYPKLDWEKVHGVIKDSLFQRSMTA